LKLPAIFKMSRRDTGGNARLSFFLPAKILAGPPPVRFHKTMTRAAEKKASRAQRRANAAA
jgi:hypothetical protein